MSSDHKPVPPPAPKGNMLAVKHGAHSPRLVNAAAAEILPSIEAFCEGFPAGHPAFRPLRELLAVKMARHRMVSDWLDEHFGGRPISRKGQVLKPARLLAAIEREIEATLRALGLTVEAAGRLGVNLARTKSLAERLQEARAAQAREAEAQATPPASGGAMDAGAER